MSPPTTTDGQPAPNPALSPAASPVPLSQNNMDAPEHETLYQTGLAMRKRVVGEDYVANALEKGSSDFLRPLQQFATV
jgi:4-carboxymuconolactone decarboxylase